MLELTLYCIIQQIKGYNDYHSITCFKLYLSH